MVLVRYRAIKCHLRPLLSRCYWRATSQGFELGSDLRPPLQKVVDLVPGYGFLMGIQLDCPGIRRVKACWIARC